VSEFRLVCPHCGHNGTPGTATSSLACYGFNYLGDVVVCREIHGFDAGGRLRLGGEARSGGGQGGNARIECRYCWQTFPLPEGVEPMLDEPQAAPAMPAGTDNVPAGLTVSLPPAASGTPDMSLNQIAQQIAGAIVDLLSGAMQDAQRRTEGELNDLQGTVAGLTALAEKFPALAAELAGLRKQTDTFAEAERNLSFKLARLEVSLHGHQESHQKIEDDLRSVSAAQEEIRRTLEAQTGAIGGLERATSQLDQTVRSQQELIEQHSQAAAETASQIGKRVSALDGSVAQQAHSITEVRQVLGQLGASHESLQGRVDRQADALRSLHAVAEAQAGRRDEVRAALQKLEDLAGGTGLPPSLPEDL